jgi:5-formyltetrahydrofolate cyclo-ligase
MPPDTWRQRSQQICEHLCRWQLFCQAQTVAVYFSTRQEPCLESLGWQFSDKTWIVPRCQGPDLTWHLRPQHGLEVNRWGISEPPPTAPPADLTRLNLVLVPCVAADRQKYRLGYGGGFYDRWLPTRPSPQCPTVGVLFAAALQEDLPHDPWDVPLDYLVTEEGLR